jgi:hypothetical protein
LEKKKKVEIYLGGGLTDNGRNGTNDNVEERNWSNEGHVRKFEGIFCEIIRSCEFDFREFFLCDWLELFTWISDIVVWSTSTASSKAFIDNLTSGLIGSMMDDW